MRELLKKALNKIEEEELDELGEMGAIQAFEVSQEGKEARSPRETFRLAAQFEEIITHILNLLPKFINYQILQKILSKYPYHFYAYGSRVKGTARKFSDLDICYHEDIPDEIICQVKGELEEIRENDELSLKNNQFTLIDKKEQVKLQFSLDDINCIILENSHSRLTSHLLSKLAENNISLIVTNEKYDPTGLLISLNQHFSPLSVFQNGDKTNREGVVAKYFFQKLYGKDFVRFSDDNINGALNYGYKILTSAISRTLTSYGLNNHLGIKHLLTNFAKLEKESKLSSQVREGIAKIIYYPVKINKIKTKVYVAIDIMIKSFISCLKENSTSKIRLPTLIVQGFENEEEG
ncbi:19190_t:CDS:2 [Funneliformis geosporum]|uniref:18376_t:CDS:1 n=1 Tax=Funneliformis geosporum TaxID=1117311 RepID=A0A9W4T2H1_9GLOM|nr:19190_t:CDS:2 [Funneliformis geosporum]CAI2192118.1 18376_t:CDS:2 [Funneliformis geosporum]